jgi:thiol-disulfide isomerase/thioredoxin
MKELESDNLQDIVKDNKKVLVQYGASWCGICKIMKPKLSKMSEEVEGIQFVYADAEKFPQSRELAEVNNLPTFAGFVDGKLVKQAMGSKIDLVQEIVDEIASH